MQKNHFLLLKNFKNTSSAQLCLCLCVHVNESNVQKKLTKNSEHKKVCQIAPVEKFVNSFSFQLLQPTRCLDSSPDSSFPTARAKNQLTMGIFVQGRMDQKSGNQKYRRCCSLVPSQSISISSKKKSALALNPKDPREDHLARTSRIGAASLLSTRIIIISVSINSGYRLIIEYRPFPRCIGSAIAGKLF